jgi:hypothetical protein
VHAALRSGLRAAAQIVAQDETAYDSAVTA